MRRECWISVCGVQRREYSVDKMCECRLIDSIWASRYRAHYPFHSCVSIKWSALFSQQHDPQTISDASTNQIGPLFFYSQEVCGNVNDKYIEYELTLVAIDIILHRKPALRHLLHNRQEFESTAVRFNFHWCDVLQLLYQLNHWRSVINYPTSF